MGKTTKTAKTTKKAATKGKSAAKPVKTPSAKAGATSRAKVAPAKKEGKGDKVEKVTKKSAAKGTGEKVASAGKAPAGKGAGAKGEAAVKAPPAKGGAKGAAKPSVAKVAAAPAAETRATESKSAETKAPAAAATAEAGDKGGKSKAGPKGITIVHQKPSKPSKPKVKFQLPQNEPLLKPGAKWKPLIPSGPSAPPRTDLEHAGPTDGTPIKTKLSKKDLERYRQVLLSKRAELVGDVRNMESEALLQNSGSLSHTPQHMAEQGTDVFDQSLNLDLAAVDRGLIREIDAALERIDAGTYGVCELTGKLISTERLDELPWTRYSIEAARERERRSFQL